MSQSEQLVGAVLNGRFRLVRLLGEGGMGAVYEAESTHGGGKRAVKLLHQEFIRDEQVLARFFAEAQATRSLQHPNVAQVLETATAENGTPYLVMELLQGVPLASYTDQGRPFPAPQAVNIVYGLLQALSAAHGRGIVHRDIKPDNLFLVPDENGAFNVKVLDFGIAKVMDVAGGMGQKTRTGVLLGTPGYMSPEQVKNSKAVDPRSDLWSVAVIHFELLTGQPPFPGDNEFARLTSVLSEEPKPIGQIAPGLALWASFFQRALAKDPGHRFQSADEMAQGLLAAARGVSLRPPPPTLQAGQAPCSAAQSPGAMQQSGLLPAPTSVRAPHGTTAMPASMMPTQLQSSLMQAPMSTPYPPLVEAVPSRPSPTVASAPLSLPTYVSGSAPPPPPGTSGVGPTHVSAQRPPGTPTVQGYVPPIQVIDAPRRRGGAPWWVVGVVGFVAFGLGLALGMLSR